MTIEINGEIDAIFYDNDGNELEDKEIFSKLKNGDYTIGLSSKKLYDVNDLTNPIGYFIFDVGDNTEYEYYV